MITADTVVSLSPTLPMTTGPIYHQHQHQAGMERSDVSACLADIYTHTRLMKFLKQTAYCLIGNTQ